MQRLATGVSLNQHSQKRQLKTFRGGSPDGGRLAAGRLPVSQQTVARWKFHGHLSLVVGEVALSLHVEVTMLTQVEHGLSRAYSAVLRQVRSACDGFARTESRSMASLRSLVGRWCGGNAVLARAGPARPTRMPLAHQLSAVARRGPPGWPRFARLGSHRRV